MDITGLGSIADLAKGIIDKIWPPQADPNEKLRAETELRRMLQERENAVIEAQRAIMVAEMQQGDAYTKRARPTVVYAGLVFIFLVHVAFPIISWFTRQKLPDLALPEQFWWAWSGVVAVWFIGRSAERRGVGGQIVKAITGGT